MLNFSSYRANLLVNAFFTILVIIVGFNIVSNFLELNSISKATTEKMSKISEFSKFFGGGGGGVGCDEDFPPPSPPIIEECSNTTPGNNNHQPLKIKEPVGVGSGHIGVGKPADKIARILNMVRMNKTERESKIQIPAITETEMSGVLLMGRDNKEVAPDKFSNDYLIRDVFIRTMFNALATVNSSLYKQTVNHAVINNSAIISTGISISDINQVERPIGILTQTNAATTDCAKLAKLLQGKLAGVNPSSPLVTMVIDFVPQPSLSGEKSKPGDFLFGPDVVVSTNKTKASVVYTPLFSLFLLKRFGVNGTAYNFLNKTLPDAFFSNLEKYDTTATATADDIRVFNWGVNSYDEVAAHKGTSSTPFCIIEDGEGGVSELILASFEAGLIPIYFGTSSAETCSRFFNEACFVNGSSFPSRAACLSYCSENKGLILEKALNSRSASIYACEDPLDIAPACFYGAFYRSCYQAINNVPKNELTLFVRPITLIDYPYNVKLCFEKCVDTSSSDNDVAVKRKKVLVDMCIKLGLLAEDYTHDFEDDDWTTTLLSEENNNKALSSPEILICFSRINNEDHVNPMTIEAINRRAKREILDCYSKITAPGDENKSFTVTLEMLGKLTMVKKTSDNIIESIDSGVNYIVKWIKNKY